MQKVKILSLLAAVLTVAVAGNGNAQSTYKDVVKDVRGTVIKNTWNNCVRTKWDAATEQCEIDGELLAVYFGFDSDVLTPAAKQKLDTLVGMLSNSGVSGVSIVGYADPIGNADYNYNLSNRRAAAVEKYLKAKGYISAQAVDVRGMGEGAPVSECSGLKDGELKACLWRDRRVEIKLNH